jgi:hypothetical protein
MEPEKMDSDCERCAWRRRILRRRARSASHCQRGPLREVDVGAGRTIMLSPDAMVPTEPARGVILHFRVADVNKAVERARSRGATVLLEPMTTDWGWESAMLGPGGVVIDLYRELGAAG